MENRYWFDKLPDDIKLDLEENLDPEQFEQARGTCRSWDELIRFVILATVKTEVNPILAKPGGLVQRLSEAAKDFKGASVLLRIRMEEKAKQRRCIIS